MPNLLVSCVNKTTKSEPDQRILYIGGVYNDQRWKHSLHDAIFHMEMTMHSYHIQKEGQRLDMKIAFCNGNKYLKTKSDVLHPESLLGLPECPH